SECVMRCRSCFSSALNSSFSGDIGSCSGMHSIRRNSSSRSSPPSLLGKGGGRLGQDVAGRGPDLTPRPPSLRGKGEREYVMRTLADLPFDNTYARLPAAFYQRVEPTPVPDPYLVAFNPDAAKLIDLDAAEAQKPDFVEYFAGNKLVPGSEPV